MKKIITLILIAALSLGIFACGNNADNGTDDSNVNNVVVDDSNDTEIVSENGEIKVDEKEANDLSDIVDENFNYEDEENKFDFKFSMSSKFPMSTAIEKIDYSDISTAGSQLEKNLQAAADKTQKSSYEIFSDYEEDGDEEIDKIAYVIGMENNDTEGVYLESGVFHKVTDDKYYQYITYCSENLNAESGEAAIEKVVADIKDCYGIDLPLARVKKAIEMVLQAANEKEDYYSLYTKKCVKGNGYLENVKVSVDGFVTEDGEIGYYLSVDRERCYA